MKKYWRILFFLLLAAGLLLAIPSALRPPAEQKRPFTILRVWNAEEETAVHSWLRGQARAFERATGQRVYLRTAAAGDAVRDAARGLPPDALILPEGDTLLALRGYALIVRDDSAAALTPAPTGALFFRPSPTAGPAVTPAPWPDSGAVGAVLCPEALRSVLPGAVVSAQPAADLSQGKAGAALLTPGQAAGLNIGFRVYAVPEGKGFLPVKGRAYTEMGRQFLTWLQDGAAQRALAQAGLFSPGLRLYAADDPIRYLIESSYFSDD